ncbi:MAG: nucleotidyltransferase family protein [Candidatus Xenobia bacterium]
MHPERDLLDPTMARYYRRGLEIVQRAGVPFLIGGAYAFAEYTGIARHTKDLDIFVRAADARRALDAMREQGLAVQMTFPHWLGKAWLAKDVFIDVIFSSGNGVATVDDLWFSRSVPGRVMDFDVRLIPAEEMIWSKGYIMERERYDGADVAHLIDARADQLDWDHLVARFGPHWRVLLNHLILFGFIFPASRHRIPARIMKALIRQLHEEMSTAEPPVCVCGGTLLSRQQYLTDLEHGCQDPRRAYMSDDHIEVWTNAIYHNPEQPEEERG